MPYKITYYNTLLYSILLLAIIACIIWVDYPLALYLQANQGVLYYASSSLTHIGSSLPYLVIAVLLCIMGLITRYKKLIYYAVDILCYVIISGLLSVIVKLIIGRGRPKLFIRDEAIYPIFHIFEGINPYNSLPSGHSVTVFSMAALCFMWVYSMKHNIIKPILYSIIAIIALYGASTRVIIGAHFLSDIIASLLLVMITHHLYAKTASHIRHASYVKKLFTIKS